jgi:hypothetical protein
MARNLGSYLHDHLAGANMAVDLIQTLLENQANEAVRNFLSALLLDVAEDRHTLQNLASEMGYGSSMVKNTAAHLAAKATALKLGAGKDEFGLFESFEFLALGILGKLHLWKALRQVEILGTVAGSIHFDHLIKRAEAQCSAVERYRLANASEALRA